MEALGDLRLACRLPCLLPTASAATCVDSPVCVQAPFSPLQTATRWVPFGARMAYTGGMLSPQEDGSRKEACADPGSGCGALEAGNSGVLGPWPGMQGLTSGGHDSLALQTAYPMGWGTAGGVPEWASEGEAPPCQGPGATLGPSALLLC